MELKEYMKRLGEQVLKYKYAMIVLLLGIALMCIPWNPQTDTQVQIPETAPSIQIPIEKQLEELICQMQGAGKVKVMVSISSGEKTVYQFDENMTMRDNESSVQKDTVIITDSDRNQSPLISQIIPPAYLGVVVVCQGADQPAVKLAVVEAVSKLTGLGADRISVLKMK